MRRAILPVLLTLGLLVPAARGQGDPEILSRIADEGTANSQVWELMSHLSEQIGPRLTGSTREAAAQAWAVETFSSLGLHDARLLKWGEIPVRFDRGPSRARMVEPIERDFEFTARSWSAGTTGPVRARVIKAPETIEAAESMAEDLAGSWVLSRQPTRRRRRPTDEDRAAMEQRRELDAFLRESGIAGRIYGARGDLVTTGADRGWRELAYDALPQNVSVTVRRVDYDVMNSRLADGEEVVVEIDLQHHFAEGPIPLYNVVAEIPGTEFPEQVVILSGHLDSWDGPGSLGAQDNAGGCAVALEAARILMAAGAKPRRTIRFILWSGEEQGLLGSRAYVESLSEEELAGISAVLVEDGGTNYEGGLVCVAQMAPMLTEATAFVGDTFPDMPVEINVRERMPRGGGSDHVPFNRAGVPGFFWSEEGVGGREGKNYRFIHHTQHDIMRYAVPEYMVQSATCSAITVYNLAMADTLLPRYVPPAESPVTASAAEEAAGGPWTTVEGPLSGTWVAAVTGEMAPPDSEFRLIFEMSDDGRVRGRMTSQMGEGRLRRVRFDPESGTLTFSYASEAMGGMRLDFNAKLEGETITGTMDFEGEFSMPFAATREKAADIAAAPDPGHDAEHEDGD
ncbi:MAG: M28 family metallopeptidase [Planctomycetota bacterium]|jgi:hypothetical protein